MIVSEMVQDMVSPIVSDLTPGQTSEATLTWTDNAGGFDEGYRVYQSTDGGASFSLHASLAAGSETGTVDDTSGYQYYVVAFNDAGESDPSGTVTMP